MKVQKTKLLTGLSVIFVATIVVSDFDILKNGLTYISKLNTADEYDKFAYRLATANFIFDIIGIVVIILGLTDLIKYKDKSTIKAKVLWFYVLICLILLLPLYHRHPDIGGNLHGHSFWNGGLHLH
jgi:hypothetical protein